MRQVMSTALVALIIGALAGATMGAVAQSEPAAERAIDTAGLNADKVDGRHAVKYTNSRGARRGKLVATNNKGELPSNIVRPLWGLVRNMPAGFADGVDNVGITGLKVVTLSAQTTITPGIGFVYSPPCPAGSVVTGGGGYASFYDTHLAASGPFVEGKWLAAFENTGASTRDITAWVMCLSVDPASGLTTANRAPTPAGKVGR